MKTILLLCLLSLLVLPVFSRQEDGSHLSIAILRGVSSDGDDGLMHVLATNKMRAVSGRLIISEISPCGKTLLTYDIYADFSSDEPPYVRPIPLGFGVPDTSCGGRYYLHGILIEDSGSMSDSILFTSAPFNFIAP